MNFLANKFGYEIASNLTGRKIERATINKFELAEEKDYIDITYILASSVANGNGALFLKEELEERGSTIVNTPLIIVPSWSDNSPTGHSVEDFPKIGWDAKIIGTHIASETFEEDGITHLKTTARVWKIRYPEIAQTLVNLHELGKLTFSMETRYSDVEVNGTVRTLKGINFIGSAAVDDPANPYSYSLEVAKRRQKEEKVVTFEQAMQILKEANADAYLLVTNEVATLRKTSEEVATLKTTNEELVTSLGTANSTADTLKEEVAEYKRKEEEAATNAVGEARLAEMAKHVTYTDEEKAAKKATFASMDESVFNLLLETAQKNKPAQGTEVAGLSSDTKIDIAGQGFLDGIEDLD
ncbi:hypothetical protein [Microcystis phage MaeS]|nr:hypothetical protein [Microcystis phage MaeS]